MARTNAWEVETRIFRTRLSARSAVVVSGNSDPQHLLFTSNLGCSWSVECDRCQSVFKRVFCWAGSDIDGRSRSNIKFFTWEHCWLWSYFWTVSHWRHSLGPVVMEEFKGWSYFPSDSVGTWSLLQCLCCVRTLGSIQDATIQQIRQHVSEIQCVPLQSDQIASELRASFRLKTIIVF